MARSCGQLTRSLLHHVRLRWRMHLSGRRWQRATGGDPIVKLHRAYACIHVGMYVVLTYCNVMWTRFVFPVLSRSCHVLCYQPGLAWPVAGWLAFVCLFACLAVWLSAHVCNVCNACHVCSICTVCVYIHAYIRAEVIAFLAHSFISYSLTRLLSCFLSVVLSFVHSPDSSIHSLIRSFVCSFIHAYIRTGVHTCGHTCRHA